MLSDHCVRKGRAKEGERKGGRGEREGRIKRIKRNFP